MSENNHPENETGAHSDPSPDTGVPGLIDQYKQQRRAWLAQADELVRLRDEVRSAAEREAMDIVTAARRDVRQIVVEARRELMVLTAQLHAAMEAVDQSSAPPARSLHDAEDPVSNEISAAENSLGMTRDLVLGARREVRGVLDEARAEIEALASEAPIPFPTRIRERIEPEPRAEKLFFDEPKLIQSSDPDRVDSPRGDRLAPETPEPSSIFADSNDFVGVPQFGRSEITAPFASRGFESMEDSAPRSRAAFNFVGLFAAVGVLITAGTAWWILSGRTPSAREPEPAPAAVTLPPTESTGALESGSDAPSVTPTPVALNEPSLTIETRRPAWIRASVDGQPDAGRLYKTGEKKEIVGARAVVIRAGDAGAVLVSVNGAEARPLGSDGAVMTRRYVLDEIPDTDAPRVSTAPDTTSRADERPLPLTPAGPVAVAVESTARPPASRPEVRTPAPRPEARTPAPRSEGRAPTPAASANPAPASQDASPIGDNTGGRPDLVSAGQQWLDAYQRRDRDAMSTAGTENITVTDERSASERFPTWQTGVQRELDQVELALTGDTALLTARMTERTDGAQAVLPHVSRVSQIWVRRAGQWRLADVRIIAENRLNQIVR